PSRSPRSDRPCPPGPLPEGRGALDRAHARGGLRARRCPGLRRAPAHREADVRCPFGSGNGKTRVALRLRSASQDLWSPRRNSSAGCRVSSGDGWDSPGETPMKLRWFLVSLALLSTACRSDPLGSKVSESATRHVTILFAADLHAQLEEHDELFWRGEERIEKAGGFARLAKAIRKIREERGGAVLAIDGGDTIQGSAAAAWT